MILVIQAVQGGFKYVLATDSGLALLNGEAASWRSMWDHAHAQYKAKVIEAPAGNTQKV